MNCHNLSGFAIARTDALFNQITYMLSIHHKTFFIKNKIKIDNIGHPRPIMATNTMVSPKKVQENAMEFGIYTTYWSLGYNNQTTRCTN